MGLTETKVTKIEEIMEIIHKGLQMRISGTTGANAESSRSHAILTYFIKHNGKLFSKMSFIDLAGSERIAKSGVINMVSIRAEEAKNINASLSALGKVID